MDNNNAAFVGSIPDFYDRGLGPVLFEDFANLMAGRVASAQPASVLETAAGTGIVTQALQRRLPGSVRIAATDLNSPMLDVARSRLAPGRDIRLEVADAQQLPFPDGSFEAMVCQFGIMFFPDRPRSFEEAFRVLAPGGHYHFSVWDTHRFNSFAGLTHALLEATFPVNPPMFYAVPFSCAAIDPIKQMVLDAGFTDLEITVSTIRKPVADLEMFSRGLIYGNPLADQIKERGGPTPEAIRQQLFERLARAFGAEQTIVPLQTIFYTAKKPIH